MAGKIKEQTKKAEAKFERLLEGCLDDLPNLPHSTVRIFMSSTFSGIYHIIHCYCYCSPCKEVLIIDELFVEPFISHY